MGDTNRENNYNSIPVDTVVTAFFDWIPKIENISTGGDKSKQISYSRKKASLHKNLHDTIRQHGGEKISIIQISRFRIMLSAIFVDKTPTLELLRELHDVLETSSCITYIISLSESSIQGGDMSVHDLAHVDSLSRHLKADLSSWGSHQGMISLEIATGVNEIDFFFTNLLRHINWNNVDLKEWSFGEQLMHTVDALRLWLNSSDTHNNSSSKTDINDEFWCKVFTSYEIRKSFEELGDKCAENPHIFIDSSNVGEIFSALEEFWKENRPLLRVIKRLGGDDCEKIPPHGSVFSVPHRLSRLYERNRKRQNDFKTLGATMIVITFPLLGVFLHYFREAFTSGTTSRATQLLGVFFRCFHETSPSGTTLPQILLFIAFLSHLLLSISVFVSFVLILQEKQFLLKKQSKKPVGQKPEDIRRNHGSQLPYNDFEIQKLFIENEFAKELNKDASPKERVLLSPLDYTTGADIVKTARSLCLQKKFWKVNCYLLACTLVFYLFYTLLLYFH